MIFKNLTIENWQQIDAVDIAFHDRLTVLTGANGSGKTTLLRMLGRQFGWRYQQLGTPKKDSDSKTLRFFVDLFDKITGTAKSEGQHEIGSIGYSDGSRGSITVPGQPGRAQYTPNISSRQNVEGLFLPADRPEFSYAPVNQIPTKPRTGREAFNYVSNQLQSQLMKNRGDSVTQSIKEVLIGLAFLGYPSKAVEGDREARHTFEGFQEALHRVLPEEVGFERLEVRTGQGGTEIVLVTATGEFLLDAISGGISALFTLTWLVYMYSSGMGQDEQFSVVIDEPETHLHASLQRNLFPNLLDTFPQVQFIIATHSPLIVGSVKDSNVYALIFEEGSVVDRELDLQNKAGTANAVLRDVLGVPATMPIWVEEELEAVVDRFEEQPLNEESLNRLRESLADIGLEEWIPEALSGVLREKEV